VPRGEGVGSGRGAVAPPQYGGLGHCPHKILKFNSANLFIFFHDFKTEIALPFGHAKTRLQRPQAPTVSSC